MVLLEEKYVDFHTVWTIVTLIVVFGSFFGYNWFNARYWDRGVFPPFLRFSRTNYYEAVVNVGANIIRSDKEHYFEKQNVLNVWLRRKFPDIEGGMNDSFKSAISVPVSTASVGKWLSKRVPEAEKGEMLDFFFTLASHQWSYGRRERDVLRILCESLSIPAMVLEKQTERYQQALNEYRKSGERIAKMVTFLSGVENARLILGLKEGCTLQDVKKAYRKLAKRFHPDTLRDMTEESLRERELRFIEIQEAYSLLTESL